MFGQMLRSNNDPAPAAFVFNGVDEHFSAVIVSSSPNRRRYSLSVWAKWSALADSVFIGMGPAVGDELYAAGFIDRANDVASFHSDSGGTTQANYSLQSNDPSVNVWHHYIFAIDNSQSVLANRCKIYLNGVQLTVTASTTMLQNVDTLFMVNGNTISIGCNADLTSRMLGKLAFIQIIEGIQITQNQVGESGIGGVWQHKKFEGDFGTHGLYLPGTKGYTDVYRGLEFTPNSMDTTNLDYADLPPHVSV